LQAKLLQANQKLALEQEKTRVETPTEIEIGFNEMATEERKLRELEQKHHKLLAENNTLKQN